MIVFGILFAGVAWFILSLTSTSGWQPYPGTVRSARTDMVRHGTKRQSARFVSVQLQDPTAAAIAYPAGVPNNGTLRSVVDIQDDVVADPNTGDQVTILVDPTNRSSIQLAGRSWISVVSIGFIVLGGVIAAIGVVQLFGRRGPGAPGTLDEPESPSPFR
jgi:hypothetical protein